MARIRRLKPLGPLQDLLLKCCPPDDKGRVSIPLLATEMGVTSNALYKWIKQSHVPSKCVFELVKLSGGKVEWNAFLPYVFDKNPKEVRRK